MVSLAWPFAYRGLLHGGSNVCVSAVCVCWCVYACVHVRVWMCICQCIHHHTHTHTHTHTQACSKQQTSGELDVSGVYFLPNLAICWLSSGVGGVGLSVCVCRWVCVCVYFLPNLARARSQRQGESRELRQAHVI